MVHCNRIIVLYSISIRWRDVGLIIQTNVPLILYLLHVISIILLNFEAK